MCCQPASLSVGLGGGAWCGVPPSLAISISRAWWAGCREQSVLQSLLSGPASQSCGSSQCAACLPGCHQTPTGASHGVPSEGPTALRPHLRSESRHPSLWGGTQDSVSTAPRARAPGNTSVGFVRATCPSWVGGLCSTPLFSGELVSRAPLKCLGHHGSREEKGVHSSPTGQKGHLPRHHMSLAKPGCMTTPDFKETEQSRGSDQGRDWPLHTPSC